jgi:hypothetical protein
VEPEESLQEHINKKELLKFKNSLLPTKEVGLLSNNCFFIGDFVDIIVDGS